MIAEINELPITWSIVPSTVLVFSGVHVFSLLFLGFFLFCSLALSWTLSLVQQASSINMEINSNSQNFILMEGLFPYNMVQYVNNINNCTVILSVRQHSAVFVLSMKSEMHNLPIYGGAFPESPEMYYKIC